MAELSREEFLKMQREAEERLRRMQQKSAAAVMPPTPDFVSLREKEDKEQGPKVCRESPQRGSFNLLRMLNIKDMQLDSDRLLIIAVLLLLLSESSDELLMLALIYIML